MEVSWPLGARTSKSQEDENGHSQALTAPPASAGNESQAPRCQGRDVCPQGPQHHWDLQDNF